MKLISVKILGDSFRSLSANKLYEFNLTSYKGRLGNKIFAGLNGSGKSNFLELFSEIFYFLETYHLKITNAAEKRNKNIGFEIEYLLPKTDRNLFDTLSFELLKIRDSYITNNFSLAGISQDKFETLYNEEIENEIIKHWRLLCDQLINDEYIHVRILKELDLEPQFFLKRKLDDTFFQITNNTANLLPRKIIAYTSGQNELLSNPYHKIKYHYFKENEAGNIHADNLLEKNRLFFIDYSANFSIFIANMLLADGKKIQFLKDIFQIQDLNAFRITINFVDKQKVNVSINENLRHDIEKLKLCSTSWIEKKLDKESILIIDFKVTSSIKEAFKFHFKNAFNLFKTFYSLETLNLYLIDEETRELILNAHKSLNLSEEIPNPDPSRLIFRIEKIFINKVVDESNASIKPIYYKALSDGEHQFNEVIGSILMMEEDGCLFLLDEPDTHFNPKWRAKMIQMLNKVAAISFDHAGRITEVRKQEIIITTHSPFVISDSITNDVYKFQKKNGIVQYENPNFKTYGTSISIILDEIFEKEETISDMAKSELKGMIDDIKTIDELRLVVNRLNSEFGESAEKFDLFSKLRVLKNQIEKGNP